MPAVRSAGLLLWRRAPGLEVFLAHMGGPLWAKRDDAAWSVPKGLYEPDEEPLVAAIREFTEEVGAPPPPSDYTLLGEFRQSSGKVVTVYAGRPDRPDEVVFVASNLFSMQWPPRSGRIQEFPEMDAARWVPIAEARVKVVKGQLPVLDELERHAG